MSRKTLIEELQKGPFAKFGAKPYSDEPSAPPEAWTSLKPKKKRKPGKRRYLENG